MDRRYTFNTYHVPTSPSKLCARKAAEMSRGVHEGGQGDWNVECTVQQGALWLSRVARPSVLAMCIGLWGDDLCSCIQYSPGDFLQEGAIPTRCPLGSMELST